MGIPSQPNDTLKSVSGFENSFISPSNMSGIKVNQNLTCLNKSEEASNFLAIESSKDFKPNMFSHTLNPKLMSGYGARNKMVTFFWESNLFFTK